MKGGKGGDVRDLIGGDAALLVLLGGGVYFSGLYYYIKVCDKQPSPQQQTALTNDSADLILYEYHDTRRHGNF